MVVWHPKLTAKFWKFKNEFICNTTEKYKLKLHEMKITNNFRDLNIQSHV